MLDLVNTRKNVLGKAAKRDIYQSRYINNRLSQKVEKRNTDTPNQVIFQPFKLFLSAPVQSGIGIKRILNTHIQDTLPIGLTLTNDDI